MKTTPDDSQKLREYSRGEIIDPADMQRAQEMADRDGVSYALRDQHGNTYARVDPRIMSKTPR